MADDAELVARARGGEQAAFTELVSRNLDAARRTALRFGAGDDADDIVQEAFVKAYQSLGDYRGTASFRSWLLAIVANEARNTYRSRRRRDEAGARAAVAGPSAPPTDHAVESALAAEQRRELLAAMRGLPDAEQVVIAHRFLLDRTEAETATLLDVPVGTVKSRTSRALAKLRTRLGAAIAVIVLATAIILIPPARAAVAGIISAVLRFAGVEVHTGATQRPIGASPQPLPSTRAVSLDEARRLAHFPIGLAPTLGQPSQIWASDPAADGSVRVVSLFYGAVRIDEYDGTLDMTFVKQASDLQFVTVNGQPAVWVPEPHDLTYVDRTGVSREATTRLAKPTLLWQNGVVGYRIEGAASSADAIRIAEAVTG